MYSCWYWLAFTRLLKRFFREVTGFYLVFLNRISLVAWYGCVVSFGCFFFCSFLLQCVLSGHGRRRNVHQQFVVLAAVIGRQFRPTPVSFEEKKRKTDTLAQKIERKKTKAEKKSIRRRKRRRFSGGRGAEVTIEIRATSPNWQSYLPSRTKEQHETTQVEMKSNVSLLCFFCLFWKNRSIGLDENLSSVVFLKEF